MLVLSRKINEVIVINDMIRVTIIGTNNDNVKIGIDAPKNVAIYREEIWKSIQAENFSAVQKKSNDFSHINKKLQQLKHKNAHDEKTTK